MKKKWREGIPGIHLIHTVAWASEEFFPGGGTGGFFHNFSMGAKRGFFQNFSREGPSSPLPPFRRPCTVDINTVEDE